MILLLAAAAGLSPKLVSPFIISLLAAAIALSPSLSPFMISHDFDFGCRCRLVSPSLFPFITSLLAAAAALSLKLAPLHDFALGCRLVSQACLPS